MIPLCSVLTIAAWLAYVVTGMVLSHRLRAEKRIDPPIGAGRFDEQTYTPEGRRLLRIFRWWIGPRPVFVMLGLLIGGGVLCALTKWLWP
jgi:hypothetical protein